MRSLYTRAVKEAGALGKEISEQKSLEVLDVKEGFCGSCGLRQLIQTRESGLDLPCVLRWQSQTISLEVRRERVGK